MRARITILAAFALVLLLHSVAFAVPACVNGTLEDYIALGAEGCTFSGVHVANFSYDFLPPATPAHLVQVRPSTILDTTEFKFIGLWRNNPGETLHAVIKYTVALPEEPVTTHAQLGLDLGQPSFVFPNGIAEVDEATEIAKLSVFVNKKSRIVRAKWVSFMDFAPASALKTVQDTLTLDGGTSIGAPLGGQIAFFINSFDPKADF